MVRRDHRTDSVHATELPHGAYEQAARGASSKVFCCVTDRAGSRGWRGCFGVACDPTPQSAGIQRQSTEQPRAALCQLLAGRQLAPTGLPRSFRSVEGHPMMGVSRLVGMLVVGIAAHPMWTTTGSMTTPRFLPTATLLPSGKVLVAGGLSGAGSPLASAELYDPAAGTWSAIGPMATGRTFHTATLLPSGKVLVAGGSGNGVLASAELYDPATGTWTVTRSMTTAREFHTATLLASGKVSVTGGFDNGYSPVASAELYDPARERGAPRGPWQRRAYTTPRRCLRPGRCSSREASMSNPVSGTIPLIHCPARSCTTRARGRGVPRRAWRASRAYHTATLLPPGRCSSREA